MLQSERKQRDSRVYIASAYTRAGQTVRCRQPAWILHRSSVTRMYEKYTHRHTHTHTDRYTHVYTHIHMFRHAGEMTMSSFGSGCWKFRRCACARVISYALSVVWDMIVVSEGSKGALARAAAAWLKTPADMHAVHRSFRRYVCVWARVEWKEFLLCVGRERWAVLVFFFF